jgi:hypothetical protein
MFSLVFLCYRFLASRGSRRAGLVLASDFQRTSRFLPSSQPLVPSESGCKSTAFSNTRNIFFNYFETFLHCIVYQYITNINFFKLLMSFGLIMGVFIQK